MESDATVKLHCSKEILITVQLNEILPIECTHLEAKSYYMKFHYINYVSNSIGTTLNILRMISNIHAVDLIIANK